jgi:hypothetical protein
MPRTREPKLTPTRAFAEQFPLFSHENFDFIFGGTEWPIGLRSTCPSELKRRIAAASASFFAGNRSMDHTYKRYLAHLNYDEGDGSRLDVRIESEIERKLSLFSDVLVEITALEPKRLGEVVAEWTMLRLPLSMKFLVGCAHKGAFFECAAIARTLLEQIAWACAVCPLDQADKIRSVSATKAITHLGRINSAAGRLYGWLTAHAHWQYEAHIKAWSLDGDNGNVRLATTFASSEFKARSLALVATLLVIGISALAAVRAQEVTRLLSLKSRRPAGEIRPLAEQRPAAKDVKKLFNHSAILRLVAETARRAPFDSDIQELSAFARVGAH